MMAGWQILCVLGIVFASNALVLIPERPVIHYLNPKYIEYANFTSLRTHRGGDYVMNAWIKTRQAFGNNVTCELIFYEFLSNEYRRSFVEFHYKFCNLMEDKWLGAMVVMAGLQGVSCPYPAATYSVHNMTISANIPANFPYNKARMNATIMLADRSDVISIGTLDITLGTVSTRKKASTRSKP